ncbi:outer membrane beta-barrel protein [Chitinophaga lutea]
MRKRTAIFILLLFGTQVIRAQTTLKGRAIDAATGRGVGFVSVGLLSLPDSALIQGQVADSAGAFTLLAPNDGAYLLQVLTLGYKRYSRELRVNGTEMQLGAVTLIADAGMLREVVIDGERPAIQRLGDRMVVRVEGNRFFAAAASAFDVLRRIPGLDVSADGTLQLSGRTPPTVFVDGKPLHMSPEAQQAYLATLRPDMIASVDVIANPSARYDGEYKAIIDIRLRRDQALGWKGMLSANVQRNAYTMADNNLALSYKTRRFAYTALANYTAGHTVRRYNALQHLASKDILATTTRMITGNNNYNLQLGAAWQLHKDHQLDLNLRQGILDRDIRTTNSLDFSSPSAIPISRTNMSNNALPNQRQRTANLFYSGRSGPYTLEGLATWTDIRNRQSEDIRTFEAPDDELRTFWITALRNNVRIFTLQADVSRSFAKGKLVAGAKFASSHTDNDLRYDTLDLNGKFVVDSGRTNRFQYDERILAGYLGYDRSIRRFSFSLQLRAEHTHSASAALTRDYVTLLPNLSLTYNKLQFSYSRRMTRPTFALLNPFRFYNSPLNYWVGNPYLKASVTDQLQFTYTYGNLNLMLRAGRDHDPMARYPHYDRVTNVLEYLGRNLPSGDFASLEASFPITVTRWWRMQHTFRTGWRRDQTPYLDELFKVDIFESSVSGSQIFTLPAAITFDLSYYYRTRAGDGLYIARSMNSVDLALQKTWLKGKLNTRVLASDILDGFRVRYIFREKRIIDNELQHWFGNRRLGVTVSYSFGSSTHKARQARKTDEENRAAM